MKSRQTLYLTATLTLSFVISISSCSQPPPSQTEAAELARSILKKYVYTVVGLSAAAQADNEQMQNNAQRMFDALSPNTSAGSPQAGSQGQIQSELIAQRTVEANKIINRFKIKVGTSAAPGKADLVATGSQTLYWPFTFEAVDPEHPDTTITITFFAYRNTVGKMGGKSPGF
jgi:hypothetical protein